LQRSAYESFIRAKAAVKHTKINKNKNKITIKKYK